MQMQEIILDAARNAKLTAWIQDVEGEYGNIKKRPAVIIMPGGAYWSCSDREAEPVGFAYAKAGYQVFILRYAVGEHRGWPYPLNEYEQTMELIMEKQEEWHVLTDKIAVIGFSAGGHLAATVATMAEHRPAAAILGYAALNKEISDLCQKGMPYPVEQVDKDTCPCFLFAARDDNIVDVSSTIQFQQALWENGIIFESHIYAYGQHGFSTGEKYINTNFMCSRVPHWVADSIAWLGDVFGELKADGMTEPVCQGRVSGDWDENLSVNCTIGHLRKQGEAVRPILEEVFVKMEAGLEAVYGAMGKEVLKFVQLFKLKDLLNIMTVSQEEIDKLNEALTQIPNRTL